MIAIFPHFSTHQQHQIIMLENIERQEGVHQSEMIGGNDEIPAADIGGDIFLAVAFDCG